MNHSRYYEIKSAGFAWGMWADFGPYKNTSVIREVRIQAYKLVAMLSNPELAISDAELSGYAPSKSLRKRRGQLHVRAERQYKILLERADRLVKTAGKERVGHELTRAEFREESEKLHETVARLIKSLQKKYPNTSA